MYTTLSAIGIPLGLNKRWEVIDLTAYTVAQLFTRYRRAQITLMPAGATVPVYLRLSDIASQYTGFPNYWSDLMTYVGSTTLPTTTTGVVMNLRSATFCDAWKAGYKVTPVDATNVIPTYADNRTLPDVRLSREDVNLDYAYFNTHCLVNVNGYYHRTVTDGTNGIQVKDAIKSVNISGQNQVGLWSFAKVSGFTVLPVTTGMVTNNTAGVPVVNLGVSLTGKTVMMMLGGYLVQVDNTVLTQISGSSFQINFNQIDLINRYFESANYIDVSGILATTPPANPNLVTMALLTSPSAISAWLGMSQTFFVVFDCPEMFTQLQFVKRTGIPNGYIAYTEPQHPLMLGLGRQPPYWAVPEVGQWGISIYDNPIGNLLYNTASNSLSSSGSSQPGTVGLLQRAQFIQIGSDVS